VQLLFATSPPARALTAIVSQGRIGAIINSKAGQRRNLLEEAAGITGLHSRRHEAELRLQAAETNLNRIERRHIALGAQLEALKKQARQAVRYRTISESIRAADALVLLIKRAEAWPRWMRRRPSLAETEQQVTACTSTAAVAANRQANAAAAMPELRKLEAEAAARLQP